MKHSQSTVLREPARHLPALDGVRGIAILLVMIFHFSMYGHGLMPSALVIDRLYYRLASAGWIGVDLFFVLSGFLITGILHDARQGPHYFRNFYARRTLRIFPLYYGVLLLFLVVLPWLLPEHGAWQGLDRDAAWYWTYLFNVRVAYQGWPDVPALGHFWSLAVEEQFYLVWPCIVLGLSSAHLRLFCLACVGAALTLRLGLVGTGHGVAAFVLMPARMDALAAGGYLAMAVRAPGGIDRMARVAVPAAAGLGVALAALFAWRRGLAVQDPVVATVGHTLLACWFGTVLALAATPGSAARVLGSPVLRFFGRYSYGLYVFHAPLLFLAPGVIPLDLVPTVMGSQLIRQLVFMAIATGASVLLALASWHGFEKHFLKAKALFPYPPGEATRALLVQRDGA